MTQDQLLVAASTMLPPDSVRPGDAAHDAIGGVYPAIVVEPSTAEEVAATLAWASGHGLSAVILGGATKVSWGRRPNRLDVVLRTTRINRIIAHEFGDMTATIEAGARLGDVNAALALHRQRLPMDPADDGATIGGLLATNDSGPSRQRYGTPRDLVLGIRVVTGDGVLAKAGGRVVKNVAGYDLARLLCGSFGSLAAIVSATFKLAPLPQASQTVVATVPASKVSSVLQAIGMSQLEPDAIDMEVDFSADEYLSDRPAVSYPGAVTDLEFAVTVLVKFASVPDAVHAQTAHARSLLDPFCRVVDVIEGETESHRWRSFDRTSTASDACFVRASWLPAQLPDALSVVQRVHRALPAGVRIRVQAHGGIGSGVIVVDGPVTAQAALVDALRASGIFGNVVIRRASPLLKARVDVWGAEDARLPLWRALKQTFDPNNVLNAGRGPL